MPHGENPSDSPWGTYIDCMGSLAGARLGQVEDILHFLHGGGSHAVGFAAHVAGAHVDVGGFAEHIGLVEGIHDVGADGNGAVLLPKDYVVGLDVLKRGFSQFYTGGQCVGHNANAKRGEGQCFGNHGPEHTGHFVTTQEPLDVRHGHEFDRVGVQRGFVARACLQEVVLQGEVCGQLAGGNYRFVGNDFLAGAVIADADDGAVLHGELGEVAHTLACAFAVEILALELWQCHADLLDGCDGGQLLALVVHELGDVDGDVATVALCPAFLPEVACDLCYLVNHGFKPWATV